jgi:hypothetical protein
VEGNRKRTNEEKVTATLGEGAMREWFHVEEKEGGSRKKKE